MSNKKIYTYVSTEVEIDIDEILDQLEDEDLINEVLRRDLFNKHQFSENGVPPTTLYDEMKITILREAYSKYTLEQLEEKLK